MGVQKYGRASGAGHYYDYMKIIIIIMVRLYCPCIINIGLIMNYWITLYYDYIIIHVMYLIINHIY
jgi:hypothetical protein